ncbi:SDR family oxidoreductase [Polyangium jinanense]|uniref:SDR family oxidoreductase n=1 Tax=Polyangium jinanense TaxID=2829994 RepID=A0A9X3XJF3_9BACT|nr:SDR family oxidoreductase [Polyangium jinanense]MDC3962399.1 SDR family oxidoreductase [Polyangium jinanense]MDC3989291.1 SDR family oxidoreductase [Polyangium jinanense]
MNNEKKIKKTACITGAGRGIGKAVALRLAEEGYELALVARSEEQLAATAEEVRRAGGSASIHVCDVRSPEAIVTAVRNAIERWNGISLLVNNAGRGGGGPTASTSDELWREIIETNLDSVFYTTKAVLNHNPPDTLKTILSISSTGGKQGVVYAAAYSASKHGIIGFTKSLGLELAPKGITVNAVCPGFVETDLAAKARSGYAGIWGVSTDEAKRRIEQRVPIGRYIEPEEVADMVAYLASDRARGITAQAINICGGLGNY